jgi:PAS domain S-box-containing protein
MKFLLLFSILFLLLLPFSLHSMEAPRRVLIIASYHPLMKWGDAIVSGIAQEFSREASAETLYVEYLDTKRFDPVLRFDDEAERIEKKYTDRQPELIIATDDNALDFLFLKRDNLFPDIPVIYTGINRTQKELSPLVSPWASGIVEEPDFSGTLELARLLDPDLAYIAIITDATVTAKHNKSLVRDQASDILSVIDHSFLSDIPSGELGAKLSELPAHSAVLYISYIRTSDGDLFSYGDGLSFVHRHSDAPVYVVWDFLLGSGEALGGSVLRGADQGKAAASAARSYFRTGTLPLVAEDDPDYPNPRILLDYQLVRQYGFLQQAEKLNPAWLNHPVVFWQEYWWLILLVSTVFTLMVMMLLLISAGRHRLKKSHTLLSVSEERWKFALEGGGSGVWDWDFLNDTLYLSNRWYEILGYNYYGWINRYEKVLSLIHPDDRAEVRDKMQALALDKADTYELRVRKRCKDDSYRWVEDRGKVVTWMDNGKPGRIIGTQTDIHDQVRLQEQMQHSLEEKDVLIREIHHRVKNNMQIIASMLSLEKAGVKSAQESGALEKTSARIHAMASVHERLYSGKALTKVELADYIRDLVRQIENMYQSDCCITVKLNLDEAFINLDTAIPLGLLRNELLSNAWEHAFEGMESGSIELTLSVEHDRIKISVHDSGKGFTRKEFEEALENHTSLGLVLVNTLAKQLHARLDCYNPDEGGTVFTLSL